MFDTYLAERAARLGEPFREFDIATDYVKYVDGKRRQDGTRSFLASRDIVLPEGTPEDSADTETVNGLGTRKNNLVHEKIAKEGVTIFDGTFRYLEAVRAAGLRVAVVSSSANTAEVLKVTGIAEFVEIRVDAQAAIAAGLHGSRLPTPSSTGPGCWASSPPRPPSSRTPSRRRSRAFRSVRHRRRGRPGGPRGRPGRARGRRCGDGSGATDR